MCSRENCPLLLLAERNVKLTYRWITSYEIIIARNWKKCDANLRCNRPLEHCAIYLGHGEQRPRKCGWTDEDCRCSTRRPFCNNHGPFRRLMYGQAWRKIAPIVPFAWSSTLEFYKMHSRFGETWQLVFFSPTITSKDNGVKSLKQSVARACCAFSLFALSDHTDHTIVLHCEKPLFSQRPRCISDRLAVRKSRGKSVRLRSGKAPGYIDDGAIAIDSVRDAHRYDWGLFAALWKWHGQRGPNSSFENDFVIGIEEG